ncbi:hypothetical protein CHCC20323_2054 [Bacillus licheniformis]|nr:hypothetical protein CHCC20323_2054 [Bacillus licheniformis]
MYETSPFWKKRNKKGDRPWTPNARNDFMPKSANGFTAKF